MMLTIFSCAYWPSVYLPWKCLFKSLFIFLKILFIFLERKMGEEERKRKISVWEIHQLVASHMLPTGDLTRNPGMCPDWELNLWPFGFQASTQSTEPHQPGQMLCPFLIVFFLLVNCENSLCILHRSPLSDIWFANIFPILLAIFSLDGVLWSTKVFILSPFCLFFLWMLVHLVLHPRTHCLTQCHYVFFYEFHNFNFYM